MRVIPREHTATPGEYGGKDVAPMALTVPPALMERFFFGGMKVETADLRFGAGMLETYTCVKCGYVEWYCHDPEKIPIGPEYMSDVVDYEAGAPYR